MRGEECYTDHHMISTILESIQDCREEYKWLTSPKKLNIAKLPQEYHRRESTTALNDSLQSDKRLTIGPLKTEKYWAQLKKTTRETREQFFGKTKTNRKTGLKKMRVPFKN